MAKAHVAQTSPGMAWTSANKIKCWSAQGVCTAGQCLGTAWVGKGDTEVSASDK